MGRKYSDEERRQFTEANRQAWDEAAPMHAQINLARLLEQYAKPGHNSFDDHCLDRLREIGVSGKAIAQLAATTAVSCSH